MERYDLVRVNRLVRKAKSADHLSEKMRIAKIIYEKYVKKLRHDGGEGSGNFEHEGRPGEVGGSGPSDGSPASPEAAAMEDRCMLSITKLRANEKIAEIRAKMAETGNVEQALKEVTDVLDTLEPRSVLTFPEAIGYDDGDMKLTKTEDSRWKISGSGGDKWTTEMVAWDFLTDEEECVPQVTKSAMSQDSLDRWNKHLAKQSWRQNEQIWQSDGDFSDTMTLKLKNSDLKSAGDGFVVTAKDGTQYEKYEGKWVIYDTLQNADMRKIGYPTIEADFFTANFGMNGVSAVECEKMREIYYNMPENIKGVYADAFRDVEVSTSTRGTAYCTASGANVFFEYGSSADTILHEVGHAIDKGAISVTIESTYGNYTVRDASTYIDALMGTDAIQQDFESMAKVVGIETNGNGWFADSVKDDTYSLVETYSKFADEQENLVEKFPHVSDAISGQTFDNMMEALYGGHSKNYWSQPYGIYNASRQSVEYWANFCVLKATYSTKSLELLKSVTPNRYAACEKAFKEVFGDE